MAESNKKTVAKANTQKKRPGRPKKAVEPETTPETKQVETPKAPKAVKLSTIIKVAAGAAAVAFGMNHAKKSGYKSGYEDGYHAAEDEYGDYDYDDDDDSDEEDDE